MQYHFLKIYFCSILLLLVGLVSCEEYIDTEPPQVSSFTINGETENIKDTVPTIILVEARFDDEGGMDKYAINIRPDNEEDFYQDGYFYPPMMVRTDCVDVGGAQTLLFRRLILNDDSVFTGNYNVSIYSRDLEGNEGVAPVIPVEFVNLSPYILFSSFDADSLILELNDDMLIEGVMDDYDENANSLVFSINQQVYNEETEDSVFVKITDLPTQNVVAGIPYNFSETYTFDTTGVFQLRFDARDERRNEISGTIKVVVQ